MYSFQWGRLESLLDQFWPLGLDIRFKNLPVSASEPHQIMHATNLNPETNRKKITYYVPFISKKVATFALFRNYCFRSLPVFVQRKAKFTVV